MAVSYTHLDVYKRQAQGLAQIDKEARAAHKPISARKIILVGDSTTQVLSGWGGQFCANHLVSSVACIDLGRGGRSSFSYRAEGSWQIALNEMKTQGYQKTYVLIQLGHNDMPGKAGRSTDLATEFPEFIRQYVIEAKQTGAIPILVTPLTRRMFKDGVLKNDLVPWADAIRKIAAEEKVPLLDLNAASAPVSYTHLDVYKRQIYNMFFIGMKMVMPMLFSGFRQPMQSAM